MKIIKKYFPSEIPDNETNYFQLLEGYIDSIDELSSLQITRQRDKYQFRLASSSPKYNSLLINELIRFHTLLGIHLSLSKSMKTTSTIFFTINRE